MRENRPPGSMSGEWKRSKVRLLRHRQPKGPATDRPSLNHRVTPRLYLRTFKRVVTSSTAPIVTGWSDRLPGGNRKR